jgi:hypothetical protein
MTEDIKTLFDPTSHFTRINPISKKVEIISMLTGEVVWKQTEGEVVVSQFKYSVALGDVIATLMREGKSILDISKMENMPAASVIYKWAFQFPDFGEKLDEARRLRAEHFHDKALEVASEELHKDAVPSARLHVETLKWAASKGDPGRYGDKVAIDAKMSGSIGLFAIDTGIRRSLLDEEEKEVIETTSNTINGIEEKKTEEPNKEQESGEGPENKQGVNDAT